MNTKTVDRRTLLLRDQKKFQTTCRSDPSNFHAWWNLARICLELNQLAPAMEAFDKALSLKPRHLEALIGKIIVCSRAGRLTQALQTADHALTMAPRNRDLLLHKAGILHRLGQREQALSLYSQLAAFSNLEKSKRIFAFSAQSVILSELARFAEGLDAVDKGLAIAPSAPVMLLNRAVLLIHLRRYENALETLTRLAEHQALDFAGLSNKAQALACLRRFDEAEEVLTELRSRFPEQLRAREFFLPVQQVPKDAVAMGFTPQSLYLNSLMSAVDDCDWEEYPILIEELQKLSDAVANGAEPPRLEPFRLLSLPTSNELRLAVARARSRHIQAQLKPLRNNLHFEYPQQANGKLRIGYVSGDFRDHATAHLMRRLFQVHDRKRVEIFGYSLLQGDNSSYWRDISQACDRFTVVQDWSNEKAAARIAADKVHILVDLHGHTRYARPEIFALQPAPIQVGFLGYAGTTGADYIDYIIADHTVLPEEHRPYYSEQVIYLPDSYQVNDDSMVIASSGITRADQGLPEDAFVFCCFNGNQKIDPAVFAVWMNILRQTPGSILWLLGHNARAAENLRRAAQQQGIAPERLVFADWMPKDCHLERHKLADLFLDTFVYGAHTTASDALWAGLPVLTRCGDTFSSRVAASLLHVLGLPELIADNTEEYQTLALALALDPTRLAELRRRLQQGRADSALFDTRRFAIALEKAYKRIWHCFAEQQGSSTSFAVSANDLGSGN